MTAEGFSGGGGGGGGGMLNALGIGEEALSLENDPADENSLFTNGAEPDFLRLSGSSSGNGQLLAYLRRGASGETQVQDVALVAADHAADTEVMRINGAWQQARRAPAVSATSRTGEDLSLFLVGDPDAWLVGDSGDTVRVTLPPAKAGDADRAIYVEAHAGRVAGVESPGLQVLARDADGAWREVENVLPRNRFSTHAITGITGDQILIAFRGNHGVRAIGRLALDGLAVTSRATVSTAAHSRQGDLDPASLSAEGPGTVLGPRERLDMTFDVPTPSPAGARSYFLEVMGSSSSGDALAAKAQSISGDWRSPQTTQLGSPMPNPLATGTSLRMGLPEPTMVRAELFDVAGRRVVTLVRGRLSEGWHSLVWDGRSRDGNRAPAGIYLLRVTAGSRIFDRRLVVMP